jgi:DNA-binding MarR family transcriptional regulator
VSPFALGLLLKRAHARASGVMSAAVRAHGLELRHFSVLIVLVDRGPTTQRDLVEATGSDKAGIMRVVDDLEAKGLAVRRPVPGDRRVREVEITADGMTVFDAAHEDAVHPAEELVAHLSAAETAKLVDLLMKFTYPTGDPA